MHYYYYTDNDVQEAVASPLTNDNDSIGLSQFSDIDKRSQVNCPLLGTVHY